MVTGGRIRHGLAGIVVALSFVAGITQAAVVASVDRDRIESNESFTLKVTVDSTSGDAPDLSVLDDDFEIGQTSQLSEAHIVNGQVSRSMSWSIVLSPRRAGVLTVPSIPVGAERSNPLTITVTEPAYKPPGEADVFVTTEVDFEETWVQAQVLYRIKIYRAVATRQPALREPVFSGAEVLVEQASDERNYEAILNGRSYNVVEYAFAIFPQESGEISISPAKFEARVLRDGRITGRKVFESESHTITVNPIPPAPPGHTDAAWLPARDLTIRDNWSREPDSLKVGEPISRDITVSALGQLQTQIPVLQPPVVDGLNIYPDKPALDRRLESDGIRGIRTDQYAMIGVEAGDRVLPKVELPWFDIDEREWKVASLPPRTLTVLPTPGSAPPPAPVVEEPVAPAPAEPADAAMREVVYSDFWKNVALLLAAVWLLTVLAWWWSSRPSRNEREPAPVPVHKRQAKYLKAARAAAQAGDAAAVRRALVEWAELEWPDSPPRSIGELASRVAEPLAGELRRLSRASYGRTDSDWDAAALAKAIRTITAASADVARTDGDPLPPLMPG